MKKKEKDQLHTKTVKELEKLAKKFEKELVGLRIDFGAGKLKNVSSLKAKAKDLARVKTILKEKQLKTAKVKVVKKVIKKESKK